jgi:hypothetical protein
LLINSTYCKVLSYVISVSHEVLMFFIHGSLFERALSLVGKDFLCYHLWDKFIEFENSHKQLIQLATICINTLKFPTKKLHKYYERYNIRLFFCSKVGHITLT